MPYEPKDAKSVFLHALEIVDFAERAAFIARACNGNPDLQARVESLIKASSEPDSLIDGDGGPLGSLPIDEKNRPDKTQDYLGVEESSSSPLRLGGYLIREVIGRGGMGIVLRALDEKLNRVVAIKVLASDLARQPQARRRFLREAQAAAAVSHDHVVTIHAVDDGSGESTVPFIVMECVVGQSLQQKIDSVGAFQVKEILRIGMQIAFGLAAAHKQGLVHRDIKPSNILLENGVERVKITDFGLARAADEIGMTVSGQIAGTPQYMSPEQAMGQPVDQRSDLFSLGSILYAMCTGRPAFRADSAVAVLRRVCDDTPRAIDEVNPEIPDWMISIVNRLMAKKKEDRFQSAGEVATILESWLAHLQQPESAPRPAADSLRIPSTAIQSNGNALIGVPRTWWPQRNQWLKAAGQTFLLCAYLGGMICFLSLRHTSGLDSNGRATFTYEIGLPSPWYEFEVNSDPLIPSRSDFHWWSSSLLFGVGGAAVYQIYWGIEKSRSRRVSRWRKPSIMIGIWVLAAFIAVGVGQWMGFATLNRQGALLVGPNPQPEARVSREEVRELERILELALKDLEDVRRRFASHSVSVSVMTEAEARATEAELRLAQANRDSQLVERCLAILVEQHKKLLDFARKQFEAGVIPESEVRRAEATLLDIQRRSRVLREAGQQSLQNGS